MIQFLSLEHVIFLHQAIICESGGKDGMRDLNALESAVFQPLMSIQSQDLYPSLIDKAAALCYALIQNHAFIDGNKRIGHAAMEMFLLLNGYEIVSTVDAQEKLIIGIASSSISRKEIGTWLQEYLVPAKEELFS
ncbi:MAG: death-on-curing protein [bacterium]|jgi:death-on-curing protein